LNVTEIWSMISGKERVTGALMKGEHGWHKQ